MIISDIANWICVDYLNRSDLLPIANNAAIEVYRLVCNKIPFDQLMYTSAELPMVQNQDTYDLTQVPTQLNPPLRGIASIRVTFSSTNRRRPRRSHVRVYDSLSFTTPGFIATYARWNNSLVFNPPPNSSSYTFRVRYWGRPVFGGSVYTVSGASWTGGIATLTTSGVTSYVGNQITVSGVNPAGYNVNVANILTVTPTSITYSLPNNPGTFSSGGQVTDNSQTVLLTPDEWSELYKWEGLYKVYHYLDQQDKAMQLVQPQPLPRQQSPKKQQMYEVGIIPRLWNDLLTTVSQQENVDEDFSINPVIRAYSVR